MTRLTIDPVTRVGGQLRVEVEVAGGSVTDAWVSGTMYRGIERILEGRDARDAWLMAQRICGTCGTAHARASVEAVENALGLRIPTNARLLRNLLGGAQLAVDHVSAFYLRQAMDWADLRAATTADLVEASALAGVQGREASAAYLRAVRDRLDRELGSGQPGPFSSAAWGHGAYRLAPERALLVFAHYLEALDWRRRMLRLQTFFGGKSPHPQAFVLGGMVAAPPWGGPSRPVTGEHAWSLDRESPPVLGADGFAAIASLLDELREFVTTACVPDALAVAGAYRDSAEVGAGIGHYLAFGAFPADATDRPALLLPQGRVMDRNLASLVTVGASGVSESTAYAWYADEVPSRGPAAGRTEPAYVAPQAPPTISGTDRYSWVKAARYEEDPMEVGPIARLLVGQAAGDAAVSVAARRAIDAVGGAAGLFGTLGRVVARALEAEVVADRLPGWLDALRANLATGDLAVADVSSWSPGAWPRTAEGRALAESARGAIGHWVSIADGRIERYQVVDASTWNASPRDGNGRRGALEEALIGTPVTDPDRPLEVLRTIHAFDPCLACGVH
jgi:Ni,Fe-hydrogenase I large subunit